MTLAFLDIEASSLSAYSYPIEIAWVFEDGTAESWLIRPEPLWTDWAADSALVHGIAQAELAASGVPAANVARRLHDALAGCEIHSDAPEADQIWLDALMRTAGLQRPTVLHVYDALRDAFRPLIDRMPRSTAEGLARSIVMRAETGVERADGIRHRAEPDARRLHDTWQRVREQVAEALDGWPG
jgi:hypothetical protein